MNWREKTVTPSRLLSSPRNVLIIVLVLTFASLASWSFASPLVAAPDEQAHLLRAYALDHGQLGSATTPPSKVLENVVVPTSLYYSAIYPICWQMKDQVPATCSQPWPTSSQPATIAIYVDHYPPLYYLLVGTATYVSHQRLGIYLMRLLSSLMNAVMLALAAYAIARWSRRPSLFVGLYVALSPEAYFLASAVNPSGFEIATSICLWTLVAIFALERRDDPPHGLVVLLGVVATIDVLIRGLTPLWVALAGLTLIALAGPRVLFEQFRRRRDLQVAAGSVVGAALVAALWIFTQGTLNILPVGAAVAKKDSTWTVVRIVASYIQGWLREMVGILGWLDTELPGVVYRSWYAIVIGALVIALLRGSWRERGVVVALSALTVLIPLTLVTRQAKILGVVWQGRDTMPLAAGALILAVAVAGAPARQRARRARERVSARTRQLLRQYTLVGVIGVVGLANIFSFYTNLRRYAVGRYGPKLFFLHHSGWSPPTGQLATLVFFTVITSALAGVLMRWVWAPPGPREWS